LDGGDVAPIQRKRVQGSIQIQIQIQIHAKVKEFKVQERARPADLAKSTDLREKERERKGRRKSHLYIKSGKLLAAVAHFGMTHPEVLVLLKSAA